MSVKKSDKKSTGKRPAKRATTRGRNAPRPKQHAALCGVCKHGQREEIERRFILFEPIPLLAEGFGLSDDSIYRHAEYFGLDVERVSDTGKVLRHVLALGLSQIKKVDSKLFLGVIKELNKITGLHKLPEQNPADIERAEDNRKWANGQIERLMSEYDISRDDAIDLARTHAPTVVKWLM
jgi:hypothetical protein